MCGIAGWLNHNLSHEQQQAIGDSIRHRGPNDSGLWQQPKLNLGLIHKRLAIIDLSSGGHQPKSLADNSYTIVFNGEIYNYLDLQSELRNLGVSFDTNSDTEVLLKAWAQWKEKSLTKLKGMFAFAIWDETKQTLTLARDPLGIKPLYYKVYEGSVYFSSELQTFKHFDSDLKPDVEGLSLLAKYGSIPAPKSALSGVSLLPPGSYISFNLQGQSKGPQQYWHFKDCFNKPKASLPSYEDAVAFTHDALLESIQRHMVADVPIGVFLSGGIDSASVVSLMRQVGAKSIKSFSLGFEDPRWDEANAARETADTYQTDHYEWKVTKDEFRSLRDEYLQHTHFSMDGFNTWLVSKFAADKGMKVVLSGLGGDELFYGYETSFLTLPRLWATFSKWPRSLRNLAANIIRVLPLIKPKKRQKMVKLLQAQDMRECYLMFRQVFQEHEDPRFNNLKLPASPSADLFLPHEGELNHLSSQQKMSVYEIYRFMISQLLLDSDRYSMAHSLELRVPLVDSTLYEAIAQIDSKYLLPQRGVSKCLLVDAVGDIPKSISHRAKASFRLPMEEWLGLSPKGGETWEQHWTRVVCTKALQTFTG